VSSRSCASDPNRSAATANETTLDGLRNHTRLIQFVRCAVSTYSHSGQPCQSLGTDCIPAWFGVSLSSCPADHPGTLSGGSSHHRLSADRVRSKWPTPGWSANSTARSGFLELLPHCPSSHQSGTRVFWVFCGTLRSSASPTGFTHLAFSGSLSAASPFSWFILVFIGAKQVA
jgi:hypothetical protein